MFSTLKRKTAPTILLLVASTSLALAHHGWSWAEDEFSELDGIVVSVYVGNPHALIEMEVAGEVWNVELAPPRQTLNAGFTEDTVSEGDAIQAVGHRSRDPNERAFKAVRLVVDGQNYDVYPRRLPAG